MRGGGGQREGCCEEVIERRRKVEVDAGHILCHSLSDTRSVSLVAPSFPRGNPSMCLGDEGALEDVCCKG